MPFADKQIFLKKLSQSLGDALSANQLTEAMKIASDAVADFDMAQISDDNDALKNKETMNLFLNAKKLCGCSEGTLHSYGYQLTRFFKVVSTPVRQINVYHIRKYLMDEQARGLGKSSLATIRYVLSSYFKWLFNEDIIESNPMKNVASIKCPKKVRDPFSPTDLEQIKEDCSKMKDCGKYCTSSRNLAIISFLYSTGCRVSEMCALNRDSIDFQNMEVVVHGKGDKERTVFLSQVSAMFLKRYLDERDDDLPALFVGKRSNRLTKGGVEAMLRRVQKINNVTHIFPHRFRHTLATDLINRGMPIEDTRILLGHERIDTTLKYVHTSKAKVKSSYNLYSY